MGWYNNRGSSDKLSSLGRDQTRILRARESQYQRFFAPELFKQLNEAAQPGYSNPALRQQTGAINQAYIGAQRQFGQQMAQRGLVGSGAEASGLAAMGQARGSALADAYYRSEMDRKQQVGQLLQMGGSFSPSPTTAVPTLSSNGVSGMGMMK